LNNPKIIALQILQEVFSNGKYFSKDVLVPDFIRENLHMKNPSFIATYANTKEEVVEDLRCSIEMKLTRVDLPKKDITLIGKRLNNVLKILHIVHLIERGTNIFMINYFPSEKWFFPTKTESEILEKFNTDPYYQIFLNK